jgi:hypothetical protein
MVDTSDWALRRDGEDGWVLTNTSARAARAIEVEFSGRVDGQPWREGVVIRPDVLGAGEETYIKVFRSDTVTDAVITWRGRFGSRRRWQADRIV